MPLEQFDQVPRKEEGNRKEERKQVELLQEVKTGTKEELSGLKAEILSSTNEEQKKHPLEQFDQVPRKEEGNRKEERKQVELLQEVKTGTKEELSGLKAEILSSTNGYKI